MNIRRLLISIKLTKGVQFDYYKVIYEKMVDFCALIIIENQEGLKKR